MEIFFLLKNKVKILILKMQKNVHWIRQSVPFLLQKDIKTKDQIYCIDLRPQSEETTNLEIQTRFEMNVIFGLRC